MKDEDDEIRFAWLKDILKRQQDTLGMQQGQIEILTILCGRLIARHHDWKDILDTLKHHSDLVAAQGNLPAYMNGAISTIQALSSWAEALHHQSPHID
jgi:hypothetical protein